MSRGLGKRQREIVHALRDAGAPLLPREIRAATGSADRPNTRRVLRALGSRGIAVEDDSGRWTLDPHQSFRLAVAESFAEIEEERREKCIRRREDKERLNAELRQQREERAEAERLHELEERNWDVSVPLHRRRRPGDSQRRVIAGLFRYSEFGQTGLPKGALSGVCGIEDKSNRRRAIRTLTETGVIQESLDGERIRLHSRVYFDCQILPYIVIPPLDDGQAKAVLEGYGEWSGVVE